MDDNRLDREIGAYFDRYDASAPLGLQSRVVRDIEERTARRRFQLPIPGWLRIAGSVTAAAVSCLVIVALGAALLMNRGATPVGGSESPAPASPSAVSVVPTASPSATPTPETSAAGQVSVLIHNWGPAAAIRIDGRAAGTVGCGVTSTLTPGSSGLGPLPWHVTLDSGWADMTVDVAPPATPAAPLALEVFADGRVSLHDEAGMVARAHVCPTTREGTDAAANLTYAFSQPTLTTPGRAVDGAVNARIAAALDAKVRELEDWVRTAKGATNAANRIVSTYSVRAITDGLDHGRDFVSIRLDYQVDVPWAAHPPYWVDVLDFDLATGELIPAGDLFTGAAALQVISTAVANDPRLADFGDPAVYGPNYSARSENFAMWSPQRDGLAVTFGASKIGAGVLGTPTVVVPWSDLRPYIASGSYLGHYLDLLAAASR